MPGVIRAELCGSLRRRRETIEDIDILVSSDDAAPIMDAFVEAAGGDAGGRPRADASRASSPAMHVDGEKVVLNADLRVVTTSSSRSRCSTSPAARSTTSACGSGPSTAAVAQRVRAGRREEAGRVRRPRRTSSRRSGLDYIPPELREDTGEIEAAERSTRCPRWSRRGHPRRLPQPHDLQRRHRHARRDGPGREGARASSTSASATTRSR